ncbi:uncharacterized protein BDZ99DRAFT_486486 [Mytilinidion resinicola]|uniref:SWI/SNF family DNA-dependent ATPase Ris1 n=1 Tax=Mytilinidion resinicola TaxID=574789 RepID=A0A6A6YW25_9PEZI|nr:uncharacterized protein BDZ99DRAFT_486486 [Mytilinidion resinicola]KAF2813142.1 hypothetical protein BDZ99DRAFT_486486 [Mytilinidion resinicola]
MDATLMEHQKLGLSWLRKMEEGSNKGGILADDMGLGKTVQALALILARPSDDSLRKTTLIIAPVALMKQWEKEIKTKVKTHHQLKVHVYHGAGKKCNFNRLRQNDVVLTTFGTLGAEFKKKKELVNRMAGQQAENLAALEELPLVGEKCKWYRVIIDEAQCIKNKSTLNAQAAMELQSIHRLCMTGTPMMNSVDELYSLIKFLRIGPYDEWSEFNLHFARPIKSTNNSERTKQNAMKKLQALLKAILLRRTKSSLIDGKPIITIPPKHVHQVQVTFSTPELELYKALESKTQVTFNRYLRQNSVQNNYANILVLLLRLRQMCCHPHLINDLSINTSVKDIPENDLKAMAAQLGDDVVARLKGHEGEGFECPVCYDGVTNPTIFIPCGHNTCSECFTKLVDPQRAIQAGDERAQPRCPECRNDIRHDRITDFQHFIKVHMPEKDDDANSGDDEDGDSSSDSDESEDDEDETLGGFIVDDEDEGVTDNDQGDADESKVQKPKGKGKKSKGKGKAKEANSGKSLKFKKTLPQLKKESMRNKAAKDKYLRRLKADWITSAKINKTVEVLQEIEDNDPSEKTIVFSQFTSLLDLLEVPLSEKNVRYQRYDGSMKASDRVDAVNTFMETTTCKLMLISLKAGNAGLNLNKASHVIILDPFWNPYIEEQAVDRAHRMMQKREVHVHRLLVPGTVEDRILELQERKREMISMALDETAAKGIARLGRRELGFLFGVNTLD